MIRGARAWGSGVDGKNGLSPVEDGRNAQREMPARDELHALALVLVFATIVVCGVRPGPWTGTCDGEPQQCLYAHDAAKEGSEPVGILEVECEPVLGWSLSWAGGSVLRISDCDVTQRGGSGEGSHGDLHGARVSPGLELMRLGPGRRVVGWTGGCRYMEWELLAGMRHPSGCDRDVRGVAGLDPDRRLDARRAGAPSPGRRGAPQL